MAKHPLLSKCLEALGAYSNPITGHRPLNLYQVEGDIFIIRSDYWEAPHGRELTYLRNHFSEVEVVEINNDEDCGLQYGIYCKF